MILFHENSKGTDQAVQMLRSSNSLEPDQARQNVEPDLVPSYLQRLSADGKSRR